MTQIPAFPYGQTPPVEPEPEFYDFSGMNAAQIIAEASGVQLPEQQVPQQPVQQPPVDFTTQDSMPMPAAPVPTPSFVPEQAQEEDPYGEFRGMSAADIIAQSAVEMQRAYTPQRFAKSIDEFVRDQAKQTANGVKGPQSFEYKANRRRLAGDLAGKAFPGLDLDKVGYDKYVKYYGLANEVANSGANWMGTWNPSIESKLKNVPKEDRGMFLGVLREVANDDLTMKASDVEHGLTTTARRSLAGVWENMGKSAIRTMYAAGSDANLIGEALRDWRGDSDYMSQARGTVRGADDVIGDSWASKSVHGAVGTIPYMMMLQATASSLPLYLAAGASQILPDLQDTLLNAGVGEDQAYLYALGGSLAMTMVERAQPGEFQFTKYRGGPGRKWAIEHLQKLGGEFGEETAQEILEVAIKGASEITSDPDFNWDILDKESEISQSAENLGVAAGVVPIVQSPGTLRGGGQAVAGMWENEKRRLMESGVAEEEANRLIAEFGKPTEPAEEPKRSLLSKLFTRKPVPEGFYVDPKTGEVTQDPDATPDLSGLQEAYNEAEDAQRALDQPRRQAEAGIRQVVESDPANAGKSSAEKKKLVKEQMDQRDRELLGSVYEGYLSPEAAAEFYANGTPEDPKAGEKLAAAKRRGRPLDFAQAGLEPLYEVPGGRELRVTFARNLAAAAEDAALMKDLGKWLPSESPVTPSEPDVASETESPPDVVSGQDTGDLGTPEPDQAVAPPELEIVSRGLEAEMAGMMPPAEDEAADLESEMAGMPPAPAEEKPKKVTPQKVKPSAPEVSVDEEMAADSTSESPQAPTTPPAAPQEPMTEGDAESKRINEAQDQQDVRDAISKFSTDTNKRVDIADIREALEGMPRESVDEALKAMSRSGELALYENNDAGLLDDRTKAAELRTASGSKRHHVAWIKPPAPTKAESSPVEAKDTAPTKSTPEKAPEAKASEDRAAFSFDEDDNPQSLRQVLDELDRGNPEGYEKAVGSPLSEFALGLKSPENAAVAELEPGQLTQLAESLINPLQEQLFDVVGENIGGMSDKSAAMLAESLQSQEDVPDGALDDTISRHGKQDGYREFIQNYGLPIPLMRALRDAATQIKGDKSFERLHDAIIGKPGEYHSDKVSKPKRGTKAVPPKKPNPRPLTKNQKYGIATMLATNTLEPTLKRLEGNPEGIAFAREIDKLYGKRRDGFVPKAVNKLIQEAPTKSTPEKAPEAGETEFDRKVRLSQEEGQQQKKRLAAIKESRDAQRTHLQIFDEPVATGLRAKVDAWIKGGEQPTRVFGDSKGKPFKPTPQGFKAAQRKAKQLADKNGGVYSAVELRDEGDVPQATVIVEAPLFPARDWNPSNIPLWAWDYELTQMNASVEHAYSSKPPQSTPEKAPPKVQPQKIPPAKQVGPRGQYAIQGMEDIAGAVEKREDDRNKLRPLLERLEDIDGEDFANEHIDWLLNLEDTVRQDIKDNGDAVKSFEQLFADLPLTSGSTTKTKLRKEDERNRILEEVWDETLERIADTMKTFGKFSVGDTVVPLGADPDKIKKFYFEGDGYLRVQFENVYEDFAIEDIEEYKPEEEVEEPAPVAPKKVEPPAEEPVAKKVAPKKVTPEPITVPTKLTADEAAEIIPQIEAAHKMKKAEFAQWLKDSGLPADGTKKAMLEGAKAFVNRLAVTSTQAEVIQEEPAQEQQEEEPEEQEIEDRRIEIIDDEIKLTGITDQQLRHLSRTNKARSYATDSLGLAEAVRDEMGNRGIKDYQEGPEGTDKEYQKFANLRDLREEKEREAATERTKKNSVEQRIVVAEAQKRGVPLGGRGEYGLSAAKKWKKAVAAAKAEVPNHPDMLAAKQRIEDADAEAKKAKEAELEAEQAYNRAAAEGFEKIPEGQKRYQLSESGRHMVTVGEYDPQRGQYQIEAGYTSWVSPQPLLDNYVTEEERATLLDIEREYREARLEVNTRKAKAAKKVADKVSATELKEARERVRSVESAGEYFVSLDNRAKDLKVKKKQTIRIDDDKTKRPYKQAAGETWGDWGAAKVLDSDGLTEKAKDKKGVDLIHLPTGRIVMTMTTAKNAKTFALMIDDSGVDYAKARIDEDKDAQKSLLAVFDAWSNNNLLSITDEELAKRFQATQPESGITADVILDAYDLGARGVRDPMKERGVEVVKHMFDTVPEFSYDPVFVVDSKKKLVFRDHYTFKFEPEAMNLHPSELEVGQTVGINLPSIGLELETSQINVIAETLKNQGYEVTVGRGAKNSNTLKFTAEGHRFEVFKANGKDWTVESIKNAESDLRERLQRLISRIRWNHHSTAEKLGVAGKAAEAETEAPAKPKKKRTRKDVTDEIDKTTKELGRISKNKPMMALGSLDPEYLAKAVKLIGLYAELNIRDFHAIMMRAIEQMGEVAAERWKPYLMRAHDDWRKANPDKEFEEKPVVEDVSDDAPVEKPKKAPAGGQQEPPAGEKKRKYRLPEEGEDTYSIKNRKMAELLEELGLPPVEGPSEEIAFDEMTRRARRVMDNDPDAAGKILRRVEANPDKTLPGLGWLDSTIITLAVAEAKIKWAQTSNSLADAQKRNDTIEVANLQTQVNTDFDEIYRLAQVGRFVGSAAGRALASRKIEVFEDFSVAGLEMRLRDANGGNGRFAEDPAENQKIKDQLAEMAKKFEEQKKQIEELLEKLDQRNAEGQVDEDLEKLRGEKPKREKKVSPKKKTAKAKVKAAAKEWTDAFKEFLTSPTSGVDPRVLAKMIKPTMKLISAYAELGYVTIGDVLNHAKEDGIVKEVNEQVHSVFHAAWKQMLDEKSIENPIADSEDRAEISNIAKKIMREVVTSELIPMPAKNANHEAKVQFREDVTDVVHEELSLYVEGITRDQTVEAMAGYGLFTPATEDAIELQIIDLRNQLLNLSKLQAMEAGEAPLPTGKQRPPMTDEERLLISQVNEMKRERPELFEEGRGARLKSALEAAKRGIRNRISDLEIQIQSREKIIKQRTVLEKDAEYLELEKQRDALQKEFNAIFEEGITEEQRIKRAEQALDRAIKQLDGELTRGEIGPKVRPKRAESEALTAKRAQLEAMKARRKEMRKAATPEGEAYRKAMDERDEATYERVLTERIAKLQKRIDTKDFAPKEKKVKVRSQEVQNLQHKNEQLRRQFRRMQEKYRIQNMGMPRWLLHKAGDVHRLSREVITSVDWSALGRQGHFIAMAHPWMTIKAIPEIAKVTWRELAYDSSGEKLGGDFWKRPGKGKAGYDSLQALKQRDPERFRIYQLSGLAIVDEDADLNQQEELYSSSFLERLQAVEPDTRGKKVALGVLNVPARLLQASKTSYLTTLNRLRADLFDSMYDGLGGSGGMTIDQAKLIANAVNVFSGRGNLGRAEKFATGLSHVFFAPKYVASRFQIVTGQPLWHDAFSWEKGQRGEKWKSEKAIRARIAREYARYVGGVTAFYTMLWLAAGLYDDDEDKDIPRIRFNWKSSDMMKVRVGNQRIDPWGGLSQTTVFAGRMFTGDRMTQAGTVVPIRGDEVPWGSPDMMNVMGRFIRSKLAPLPGLAMDIVTQKDILGNKLTFRESALGMVQPLVFDEYRDAIKENGLLAGTPLVVTSFLGMGLQAYENGDLGQYNSELYGMERERKEIRKQNEEREEKGLEPLEYGREEEYRTAKHYAHLLDGLREVAKEQEKDGDDAASLRTEMYANGLARRAKGLPMKKYPDPFEANANKPAEIQQAVDEHLAAMTHRVAKIIDYYDVKPETQQQIDGAVKYMKSIGYSETELSRLMVEKMKQDYRDDGKVLKARTVDDWKGRLRMRMGR